jgi:hypothetical protein
MNVVLGLILAWLVWATARSMFSEGGANLALGNRYSERYPASGQYLKQPDSYHWLLSYPVAQLRGSLALCLSSAAAA